MVDFTQKEEQDIIWNTLDELWPSNKEIEQTKLPDEVDKFIIDRIKEALIECNNNRTHTAKKLGIKRETLLAKLKKFKL
jgi:transcriptional regulator with PAS, ATPase and Fis domain|tara:strand:+ start:4510 stop:4746 length:237 start_codon:yes stop_codon:yes gene_type:complete